LLANSKTKKNKRVVCSENSNYSTTPYKEVAFRNVIKKRRFQLKLGLNYSHCAKQRTYFGHSGVQPLLFVIEREGLDFFLCKKEEFWLKPK
jgi:hypothetical protein